MHTQNNISSRATFRLNNRNMAMLFVLKRTIDIIVSLVLLCLLTPVTMIITIKIYKKERRPIFYRQLKQGRNNTFLMWTFRTMTHPSQVIRNLPQGTKPNHHYDNIKVGFGLITSTGLWLRKYRLHKIPQLFNVLKGEMSLVGFKGEAADNKVTHSNWSKKIKPGMTGYVKKDTEKYCDVYYMENLSFQLDNIIMLQAIKRMIKTIYLKESVD